LTGADDTRPALYGGFGLRNVLTLNGIDPERKETGEGFPSGADAYVGFHEGGVARKVENGIARKMVRLEFVEIKKPAEEIGSGEAEATLKVSKKDDVLSGIEHRFDFVARKPASDAFRYPSRPVEPVYLVLGDVGAFPGSACDVGKICCRGPARATGLLVYAGAAIHVG
jgi:hypothetical protein